MCKKQHWLFFNYMIIHLFIYLHIFAREWIIPSTFNYLWIKKQLFYLKMKEHGCYARWRHMYVSLLILIFPLASKDRRNILICGAVSLVDT
jgi:hypothetical protein